MTSGPPSPCIFCAHHRTARTCDAYPDGIPAAIWEQGVDHFEPRDGDHGIQFSGNEKDRAEAAYWWEHDRRGHEWWEERRKLEAGVRE